MIVTLSLINRIYQECLMRPNEVNEAIITVPGMTCGAHTFHKERLENRFMQIVCGLKKLPRIMRYTQSPNGVPWILAKRLNGMTPETAENLLAMGIAIGLVRITGRLNSCCDITYVVIDDARAIRKERMKPKCFRRQGLINWKTKNNNKLKT